MEPVGIIVAIICFIMFIVSGFGNKPSEPELLIEYNTQIYTTKKQKPVCDKDQLNEAKTILVTCGYKATEAKKLLLETWVPNISTDEWTRKVFKKNV